MKLSLKISLNIAILSMLISMIFAVGSYVYQLDSVTKQNEQLVSQLSAGAERASAIALFIGDVELANEILAGLINNDLISNAVIVKEDSSVFAGKTSLKAEDLMVSADLVNPFMEVEKMGSLNIYPNTHYIRNLAITSSLELAISLLLLSFVTAVGVGLFIRKQLTHPLRRLSEEFLKVDVSQPNKLYKLDINYTKENEIGILVAKANSLISALQVQFVSEYELRKATEELQKRYRLLFEQSTAGIGLLDTLGTVTISNPAMNQLFGERLEGKSLINFFDHKEAFREHIVALQDVNSYAQLGVDLMCTINGRTRYMHCLLSTIIDSRQGERGDSEQLIEIVIYDVTLRREMEKKARFEADHDTLTGLFTRRAGTLALKQQMHKCEQNVREFAVAMIDLDRFKPINDDYGHDIGDAVLQKVTERISAICSAYDSTVTRWGGDEFLIGLVINSHKELNDVANNLLTSIRQTITIDGSLNVHVGASIGVILSRKVVVDRNSLDDLIKAADGLMYEIKQGGKDNYIIADAVSSSKKRHLKQINS